MKLKTAQATVHLQVACAVIQKNGLILAAQRSTTMSLPLAWEFPGGKLEKGEDPKSCLKRELLEELGIIAEIGTALQVQTHNYSTFCVTLHPFYCYNFAGDITLHEHNAMLWLPPQQLHILKWAEADLPIIEEIQRQIG